ncbi:MAG: RagB/SusD family nutrient uptake outer membrane protein [Mucilaginibacter sp.]|nr:RagB/SusD family nutrient uptake outer membrane protein [Mucilaginibacter sp.]
MKKYLFYAATLLPLLWAGCKKDFLTQTPKTQLTTATAFNNYNNFQTYAWGLYDYFNGYGNGSVAYPNDFNSEYNTDNLSYTLAGQQSVYAFQTKIIPGTGGTSTSLAISGWNFAYIRQVNVMLDNIDQSTMVQTDKDHWRSVGYFFRALRYYDLIAAFGNVPWVEHALTDTSKSVLFAAATPRDVVASNILSNLEFAEAHIKPAGEGVNTINVNCVRALISRFGLFEGTWRKYHGLANADTYLQACATYSAKLLPTFPTIASNYDDVYNSEDLTGQPGIILFKQYAPNLTDHGTVRYMGSTSWNIDVTKDAVESYLCTDGMPITTSTVYAGDKTMYNAFRNRDRRLYYTVVPPFKVTIGSPPFNWTYDSKPADAEYITLMNTLSPSKGKVLPMVAWSATMQTGLVLNMSPHFRNFNGGQPQGVGELGYFFWKYYNRTPLDVSNNSTNDCPLFRIEEVWLNYAEAEFELGGFTQAIANQTINKLRPRANLPNMVVSNITASFDANRDPSVDPVLWEIRRERRVELMGDGFRFNDLKRWMKGTYLNKQQLGVWVNNSDYNNKLSISGGGPSGYVQFFGVPAGWLDKYYLEPVPTQELALNPQLKQSPSW